MKLFVPGRLCLFGEHSDWAGGYRNINPSLEKGRAIIVGIDRGIYALVQPNPDRLIIKTTLSDRSSQPAFQLPMEPPLLLAEAQKGGFFSYGAGVAYQAITNYPVGGLEIDNYLTDLPIKKGLSSSAAICVLAARAFNQLYDLKLDIRAEMELAYRGEITTASSCGRMDQACAYGKRPIMMLFDGENIEIVELEVGRDLFLVIVDLGASKNTKEILSNLNQCYPFAANKTQENVREYLGNINSKIVGQAVEAFKKGDAEKIGFLMRKAQSEFDKYLIPACPSQLTAPALHSVLNYPPLQPYILGGKGVGSQGDGMAQFIVKDAETQEKAMDIIHGAFPQMQCLKLTINNC